MKSEVLSQLPPKFRQVVILDSELIKKSSGAKSQEVVNLSTLDLNVSWHVLYLRFNLFVF